MKQNKKIDYTPKAIEFFNSLPLDPETDPIIMGMYMGYNLAAPTSFWFLDPDIRSNIMGGCGPGGKGDKLVPDTMYLMSVKAACAIHDYMYAVWNTEKGFNKSNTVFKNNMFRVIKQNKSFAHKQFEPLRLRRAVKYYWFVHNFGEPSYYDSHKQYLV